MSTRSLTIFIAGYPENLDPICAMYRHMDGYPSGHGKDLARFLEKFSVVNGLNMAEERQVANGMGDLAALAIVHFKHGAGEIYLEPVPEQYFTRQEGFSYDWPYFGTEYLYLVTDDDSGMISLTILDVDCNLVPIFHDYAWVFDAEKLAANLEAHRASNSSPAVSLPPVLQTYVDKLNQR
jgi:hypothetical protein